ncbi:MAG: 4'-phosphopantetheinyl transferase superfamily protein [Opitutaceae bacterium]
MQWETSSTISTPADDHIHVWQAEFNQWRSRLGGLESMLDGDEIRRADRFLRLEDRERYVFAHGLLRRILGSCAGSGPPLLTFGTGPHGKPYLIREGSRGDHWSYNLSHSGDRILVAAIRERPVGVDVERISRSVEIESLSRRFFSAEEADHILRQPETARKAAFIDTWVCKEAFVKAVGEGLSMPLDSFSIEFDRNGTRIVRSRGKENPHLDRPWTLIRFSVAEDYSGAVAVGGEPPQVSGFLLVP